MRFIQVLVIYQKNSTFARLVEKCGMTFIGPSGDVIDQMGNKSVARQMMIEAGVPVVPGSNGSITSLEEGKELANKNWISCF